MRNGLAIIEKTDTGTTGIYIDQEALEFARQNKRTAKRVTEMHRIRRDRNRKLQAQKDEAARRKAFNLDTAKWVSLYGVLSVSATWAGLEGMMHPAICIPVSVFCLCAASMRLGKWFGKNAK